MSDIRFRIYMGNGVWVHFPGQWEHKHHDHSQIEEVGEKIASVLGGTYQGWEIP